MSMFGRLLQGIGGFYYALGDDGRQYTLRAQNKIRRVHLKPLVGDLIEFEPGTGEEDGWLKSILPRKNELVRPPVSNIDALVITVSCHVPAADLLLVDRMLVSAKRKGINTLLALNKCDLANENALRLKAEYAYCGAQVFPVSALTGEGLDSLKTALRGKIHAFAGQSGVGKSSLINALYGTLLEVGDISRRIDRGRHTTRACRLLPVNEGAVLDTPGFSLFESESCEPEALAGFYKEFQPYADKCFFQPCCHDSEPHCAVKQALIEGSIPRGRYDRYIELLNEQRERWMKRYD